MLWSLLKVLIFIAIVAALVYGAEILLASGEGLRVAFMDWEFVLGPIQAVLAGLGLMGAVWLVTKLLGFALAFLRFLLGDETAVSRYFARSRERKGYAALSDSMVALSSGETRKAMSRANKAENLLKRPDLTSLITAEAAVQSGDKARAEEVYKRMLTDQRTRFVGVRGLMKQKLEAGDTDTALKLAEKALALKPKNAETSDTLFNLQAQKENWAGARKTLGSKVKYGTLPKDVYKRRDAVLALANAAQLGDSAPGEAEDQAIHSNKLAPDFVPGAVAASKAFMARGKKRQAIKALRNAWSHAPHPDLAAAYATLVPDETPAERLKRFGDLTQIHADHPETKMLLAELHIAAEDFPGARRAMGKLAETDPSVRALTLMAAIERGEGADDAVVKGYLGRALTASRGPQWVCDNCSTVHSAFVPVCDSCQAFDTLAWKTIPHDDATLSDSAAGMLPLIVGAISDQSAPEQEAEVADVVEATAETVVETTAEATSDADAEKGAAKM